MVNAINQRFSSRRNWADGKKIVPLQIRTTVDEAEIIREAAAKAGKTICSFVLEAIRKAIKK